MKHSDHDREKTGLCYWKQFLNGEDEAYSCLFNLYSDILFHYGMKFTHDEHVVKDCIQELFIKLYRSRNALPVVENVTFFLLKSMKNKVIDYLRTNERLVYVSPDELPFFVHYSFNPEEDHSGIDAENKEKLERVLNHLTDRQKEALYLHYQMDMSYEVIAQLLQINYQSVLNLIQRSLRKIRKEMGLSTFILLFVKNII
ncbi:MAG: sigma-70 family RNA polymerase sigma factor [Dysgonamonadaceae bacterium]|nr:sigma-70 family RNA polymerase sigma factor [Dysgonamonadaceae bacterium]